MMGQEQSKDWAWGREWKEVWGRLLLPWASETGGRALEGGPQRAAQHPSGHRSSEQPKGPGA